MSLRLLATADIHIGRRPSKVDDPSDAERFSCGRIWDDIVERAVQEQVDAVLLAGDIVDHDNRFFEAVGRLEHGLKRLAAAGVHTFAVAGNHDYDVLPRLSELVGTEYFHLLGQGGQWEQTALRRDGNAVLAIQGWSFPFSHVSDNPLREYNLSRTGNLPVVGLLHADLDAVDSPYAPIFRSELAAHDASLWVVGHGHKPDFLTGTAGAAVLSPGSPQAMDPGETGPHGPWLLEIRGPRDVSASQLPLSKVRYEPLPVDLTETETREELDSQLMQSIRERAQALSRDAGALELILLRVELAGRTVLSSRLGEFADQLREQFEGSAGTATVRVEAVVNNTLPAVNMEELARNHDPPGVLARLLRQLQSGEMDGSVQSLVRKACEKQLEVHQATPYRLIATDREPEFEEARCCLIRQGRLLLDRLLTQEQTP